jgi:hypothetical protein
LIFTGGRTFRQSNAARTPFAARLRGKTYGEVQRIPLDRQGLPHRQQTRIKIIRRVKIFDEIDPGCGILLQQWKSGRSKSDQFFFNGHMPSLSWCSFEDERRKVIK